MDVEFKIEVAVSRFGRGHDAVTLRDISPEPRFQVPQLFHSLNTPPRQTCSYIRCDDRGSTVKVIGVAAKAQNEAQHKRFIVRTIGGARHMPTLKRWYTCPCGSASHCSRLIKIQKDAAFVRGQTHQHHVDMCTLYEGHE